jgi:hypothetical protein
MIEIQKPIVFLKPFRNCIFENDQSENGMKTSLPIALKRIKYLVIKLTK